LRGSSGGRLGRWGMWSALGPFAIAARLVPAVCSRLIRSIAYWEMVGGRSSRTPCARVAASAALGSLGDQLPLEGGEAGEQVRDPSSVGVGSRAQSSATSAQALLVGGRDQAGEVGQHARAPVAVGGDERLLVSGLEQRQRLRDPGALRLLGRAADLPRPARAAASAGACTRPRSPLAAPRARRGRCAAGRRSPSCIAETICCIGSKLDVTLAHSFDVSCTCRTAHLSEVDDRKSALIGRTRCVRWCVKHARNAAVKKRRFRPLAPPPLSRPNSSRQAPSPGQRLHTEPPHDQCAGQRSTFRRECGSVLRVRNSK
jgi:hypothetical protein